jgi:hypothetical protein
VECYPPCQTCTGLCKVQAPARRVVPSPGGTTKRKPKPKPEPRPGYIVLICGHYSTPEEQREWFQRASKQWPRSFTTRTKFWCEKDSAWVKAYTMSERVKAMQTGEVLPF